LQCQHARRDKIAFGQFAQKAARSQDVVVESSPVCTTCGVPFPSTIATLTGSTGYLSNLKAKVVAFAMGDDPLNAVFFDADRS